VFYFVVDLFFEKRNERNAQPIRIIPVADGRGCGG
jgi:hypothetical protein